MAQAAHSAFLQQLIKLAVEQEASDLILAVGKHPCLKVAGRLVRLEKFGLLAASDLTDTAEKILNRVQREKLAADRQVDAAYEASGVRFRVNVFYQRGVPSIVMRYVRNDIRSLKELGLPSVMEEAIANDTGLVLVVGPTGSGKSTTLAAMVDHLNETTEKHVITLEDPIEFMYEDKQCLIEQREIGVDAVSFPDALRATLREAPDVILLGEMRDQESVMAAITVAETGHLVLSTIHASSAVGAIDRIIDIFPAESKDQVRIQLADLLVAVFNQRLVPQADGEGSVVITEVMMANSAVRNAIRTANTSQLPTIIQTSSGEGMALLDDQLAKTAERGEITKETALAYAQDRAAMRKKI